MNPRESANSPAMPRLEYLKSLRIRQDLPLGAYELISEAIQEYQIALHPDFQGTEDIEMTTGISIAFPLRHVYSGKFNLLALKFGMEERMPDPIRVATVYLDFPLGHGMPIYPDNLRYIPVDEKGNSKNTLFLFSVPRSLSGIDSAINAYLFNGTELRSKLRIEFTPR